MIIPFDTMETTVIPHMKGGEKELSAKMFTDESGKILRGTLIPGATIGLHTHDTSYEVIYILSGTATMLYEGTIETLPAGSCHYCPKGKSHSLRNESDADVTFLAIVPEVK
ncbi:MAG: cupin domain-containing protein [Oscillibacter sp.]|nr:cupin domain-containing protein [Oscillibacter sp.]